MSGYLKRVLTILFLGLWMTACSNPVSPAPETEFQRPLSNRINQVHDQSEVHRHIDPVEASAQIQLVLVPSELTVGPNRFAVGIFDQGGDLVHQASVHLHFYDLTDAANPGFESEADAYPLSTEDGHVTVFAFERDFPRSGLWGAEVEVTFPDGSQAINGIRFSVAPNSRSLEPGEKAPMIRTPTLPDVNRNLGLLTSAPTPNPALYEHSLDQALASGRPTLLLFATPAFCQTRFCGPSYEIFGELEKRYRDAVNFIHVEVFDGLPNPEVSNWALAPAMEQFGLESEPWVYLIDRDGTVLYRVEGIFTQEEIEQHLSALFGR